MVKEWAVSGQQTNKCNIKNSKKMVKSLTFAIFCSIIEMVEKIKY